MFCLNVNSNSYVELAGRTLTTRLLTITSAVRGIFRQNEKTRAEAMSLIRG